MRLLISKPRMIPANRVMITSIDPGFEWRTLLILFPLLAAYGIFFHGYTGLQTWLQGRFKVRVWFILHRIRIFVWNDHDTIIGTIWN
jgi:hypothetical protein